MPRRLTSLTVLLLAAGIGVGACGDNAPASQDELPPGEAVNLALQDGLWSVAYSSSTSARTVARICVDDRVDLLTATVNRHIGSDCEREAVRAADNLLHVRGLCPVEGGGERTVSAEGSGDLVSTFSLRGLIRTQGSRVPTLNGSQNFDASGAYLGACPDGWRAGDVELEGSTARANLFNDGAPE
jgi:hypothetical protein